MKNHGMFSSCDVKLLGVNVDELLSQSTAPNLIRSDPPVHTRLRTLVNRAFSPRRIADMEPRIRELSRGLVEEMIARPEFDLIEDLAAPLPVIVIAEMLGIEPSRRQDFKRWSDDVIAVMEVFARGGDLSPSGRASKG